MRPETAHDPTVESVEELSDMGLLVVMAPPSYDRVDLFDQFRSRDRRSPCGLAADSVHEAADRFGSGVRVQSTGAGSTSDLVRRQPKLLPTLDLVPKEFKAMPSHVITLAASAVDLA